MGDKLSFSEFTKHYKWSVENLYILEASQSSSAPESPLSTFILWNKGLIEQNSLKKIVANSGSKVVKDPRLFILGNCEIVI